MSPHRLLPLAGLLLAALPSLAGCSPSKNGGMPATGGSSTTSASSGGGSATSTGSGGTGGAGGTGGVSGSGGSTTTGNPPGAFVAVGYGARRLRSLDDGKTWVDDVSIEVKGGDDNDLLRTVVWGQGTFVALGWRSMTSPDGKTWTDHGANIGQWLGAAAYANGEFAAVGGYGLRAVSADGVTWHDHAIDTTATHPADALVYAGVMGGRFVSANDSGLRSSSADGVTWTYSTGATATKTTHLAFGNGVFVGIGGTAVVTSADGGATWTDAATLPAAPDGLTFGGGAFTAVASGHVLTSPDGKTWADHPVTGLPGGPLAYGHATYVLVSGTALRRSADGLSWDAPFDVGGNALSWVTFGPVP